jgi:hypothetical protein
MRAESASVRVADVTAHVDPAVAPPVRGRRTTRATDRMIVDASIWLLFVKGLLLVPVTIATFAAAYRARKPTPIAGVASCAAGTFAFAMACVAVWVRKQLD